MPKRAHLITNVRICGKVDSSQDVAYAAKHIETIIDSQNMTDALRLGRRAFTIAVVGATIAWSIGLAAVLQPLTAQGAMAGDLIKGSLPAVYYYAADGKRYVFPNEKTFKTWYSGFSGVQTLSDAEIAAIPIGGNVTYRAGTRLVKIQTDPRVYTVEPNGVIRWVESEAVASALYGASWASRVDDVADVFFVDYTPGASLASAASYPAGSLVSPSDSDAVYYITAGGTKRMVDAAGMSANGFSSMYVIETSQNLSVYSDGSALGARDAALVDSSQMGGAGAAPGATPGAAAGGLTVSLASDTPASVTVARGASSVGLLALNLSAAGGDVTVSALTLKRVGVGATTDWANLYLYTGGSRLTDGRTVNSQTNEVSFSGLSLAVASGSTVKLWLKGDVLTTAGANTHAFQLASAAGVQSTASAANGSFPITGNSMTIGGATAGTLTIDVTGTIANPVLGTQQAEISRFTMAAATEDSTIHSLVFRIDGSVRGGDLTNFTLKQGNSVVGTAANASSDGKFVVMNLSTPYALPNGFTRTFSLYADIGGDSNRTIGIRIEHAADVVVIGSSFNQGMQVNVNGYNGGTTDDAARAACAATGQDCSFSTIQGSTLTFAFNGPVATDLASNSQDNVFMKFSITAQQWTRIDEFALLIRCDATSGSGCDTTGNDNGDLTRGTDSNATEQNLKDIKIRRVGGGTVMGPLELSLTGADDSQSLTFTEDLILQAGQTLQLEITADVDNNAVAADVFEAVVDVSTIVAEDANGDSVAAANITPTADIVGNNMTIRTAGLTVTHSVPPSDGAGQTTIRGMTGKDAVGFSFAAGQGSSISVTGLTLSTYVDGDADADVNDYIEGTETEADGGASIASTDILSSVSIYDSTTGALVAGPENVRTTPAGNVVFDNFTWTIPAGQTKKLIARANIANYTVAGTADAFAFRIDAAADITAQDQDGATVTTTLSGNMNGTTTTPTVFVRIANNGTLNSSLDADAPRADIILAGATNVVVSKVRLDAVNEGFLVDRFQIDELGAGTNDVGTTAGDYDNNISAVSISYPKQDGSTGTATSFLVGGTADFTLAAGNEIYVAKDRNATVIIMASLQTIDNGATRGEKPTFGFDANGNFQAKGVSSGATITATTNGTDANGRQMVVRETQPTIAIAAGNPTTGIAGLAEVLRFTVAAAAGEAVVLDVITFKVTATDNNGETGAGADDWNECRATAVAGALDASDFNLYDRSALSQALESADTNWTMLDSTGMTCDNAGDNIGFVRLDLTNPEVIAAGTTKTYTLEADTTGASTANDDTVRFEIPADLLVSTFLTGADSGGASNPDEVEGALTGVATAVAFDDGGDLTPTQTNIVAGDYICFDEDNGGTCGAAEEIALVTAVANVGAATGSLTVVRGSFGRAQQVIDDNADILRMPTSVVWDDDGDSSTVDRVAGYLLDNLPAIGSTFVY